MADFKLGLELPEVTRLVVVRGGEEKCRVDLDPRREVDIEPYISFFVDVSFEKLRELAEKKPGLDIVLDCEGPDAPCRCIGEDCDVVKRVEALKWEEFWREMLRRGTIVQVSTRWVAGCGTHTRVYVWPPNRIIVSHDTAGYTGVHIVYLDIEKLREKVRPLLGEEG